MNRTEIMKDSLYGRKCHADWDSMSYSKKVVVESRFAVGQEILNRCKIKQLNSYCSELADFCRSNGSSEDSPLVEFLRTPIENFEEKESEKVFSRVCTTSLRDCGIDAQEVLFRAIDDGLIK